MTVDTAANELLSADMGRRPGLLSTCTAAPAGRPALFPNLLWVVRDVTHASRRPISRPWSKDPYLRRCAGLMGRTKVSMGHMIQFSSDIRRIFQERLKARPKRRLRKVRNLRCCKHRFEAWSRSLGRSTAFKDELCETALVVANTKNDANSKIAKNWLPNNHY